MQWSKGGSTIDTAAQKFSVVEKKLKDGIQSTLVIKERDSSFFAKLADFWVMSQQRQNSRKGNFGSSNARVSGRDFR